MPQLFAFNASELADGEMRRVPDAPDITVFRVDGEFYATEDSCTHEVWSLGDDGVLEGHEVMCALHMARFDVRDGRVLCLPAERGLRTYAVSVVDGRVMVEIGAGTELTETAPSAEGSHSA